MSLNAYRIGSLAQSDLTGIIILTVEATTNLRHFVLKNSAGSNYQVPAGKNLYIVGYITNSSAADHRVRVLYGDDVADDSSPAPTNAIHLTQALTYPVAYTNYETAIFGVVPENKYPHIFIYYPIVCVTFFCLEL